MFLFKGGFSKGSTKVSPSTGNDSTRASPKSGNDADYAQEGRKMLEAVKLGSGSAPKRYSPCDELWSHPKTGATLYVGNAKTASDRLALKEYGVTRIVNCQDVDGKNYFEGDPELKYLCFTIGHWQSAAGVQDGGDGTWQYWEPYFKFITESLRDGHNVLVHCLAGAHRAGTAGIAALMFLCNWDLENAVPAAQKCRSAINPIGGFPELLRLLERARRGREEPCRKLLGLGGTPADLSAAEKECRRQIDLLWMSEADSVAVAIIKLEQEPEGEIELWI